MSSAGAPQSAADQIAAATKVSAWTGPFFQVAKLLNDTIDEIGSALLSIEDMDEEDKNTIAIDLALLRSAFTVGNLAGGWENLRGQGAPLGPEMKVFLQGASRQIRSVRAYYAPSSEDISIIRNAIEAIRADMSNVRLENVDFAREALLRGTDEVSFILERIDVFGFSRIEAPVMELGAFLFTISAEMDRQGKPNDGIKRSMSALSNAYARLKELSKAYGVAKMGYDGAHWLITHLK